MSTKKVNIKNKSTNIVRQKYIQLLLLLVRRPMGNSPMQSHIHRLIGLVWILSSRCSVPMTRWLAGSLGSTRLYISYLRGTILISGINWDSPCFLYVMICRRSWIPDMFVVLVYALVGLGLSMPMSHLFVRTIECFVLLCFLVCLCCCCRSYALEANNK